MKLLGKSWKYISEGNVHIVLQLENTNYVLRLIKEDGKPVDKEHIKESLNFVNLVMIPLLENYNYGVGEMLELPPNSLKELSRNLSQFRPRARLNKTTISPYAVKTTNLAIVSSECTSPAYCLEIKPKEGFISPSLMMHSRCYYCLKQYLKLHNKDVKQTSSYCPLDLFSGNRKRMKYSIQCLLLNPQNNIKIFKNGIMLYHDKLKEELNEIIKLNTPFSSSNLLADFIVEVLLQEKNSMSDVFIKESEAISDRISKETCDESDNLPDCLLAHLLHIQKLPRTDLDSSLVVTEHPYDYVRKVLDQLKALQLDLRDQKDKDLFLNALSPVYLSLISAVAKDCSIMISFTTEYVEGLPYIDVQDSSETITRLYYRIAITDLEPKPISTLLKRKRMEERIVEMYLKHLQSLNDKSEYIVCFRIQPHSETKAKQLEAWETLIIDYLKATKQSTIDIRESQNTPLFNNADIGRKLSQEAVLTILEDMSKTGRAAPVDKSKNVWEIYWHSLDEWGNMIYNWACNNGMNNSVCTLFELREGDNTADQEFHGLDMNVLVKALKSLELKGRCELMEFDDSQGVKFF